MTQIWVLFYIIFSPLRYLNRASDLEIVASSRSRSNTMRARFKWYPLVKLDGRRVKLEIV